MSGASRSIIDPSIMYRASWPKSPSTHVFLLEAIGIVGRALYGEDWSGKELFSLDWPNQPSAERPNHPTTLRRNDGRITLAQLQAAKAAEVGADAAIKQAAEAHIAIDRERWAENNRAVARLTNAADWLAQQGRDGKISSEIRLKSGGTLYKMEPHEWNAEPALSQFVRHGGYRRWFKGDRPSQHDVFIFLNGDTLASAVSVLKHAPTIITAEDISAFSEPLKIAISILKRRPGIISEGAKVRKSEARAEWNLRFPGAESETYIEAIATILGEPDTDKITKGKRSVKNAPPT